MHITLFCSIFFPSYYPSVFILKPGQFVHINKGRLHAFRKLSFSLLPDHDCHSKLRNEIIHERHHKKLPLNDSLCVSVAWDWTYRGFTSEGINREVSSMMECAALNRERGAQSLAIPETSLLFTAKFFFARANEAFKVTNVDFMLPWNGYQNASSLRFLPPLSLEPVSVLRGILPSLSHLVARHKAAVENAKQSAAGGENHLRFSPPLYPDCWENPRQFSIDPYGNDFFCRLCQEELANVYMHCYGCEEILNKDFNICIGYVNDYVAVFFSNSKLTPKCLLLTFFLRSCHAESRFKKKIQMHPLNNKNHSTINHTGHYTLNRQSRCPCKNGPVCKGCGFCAGCSCKCHQSFILRFRFMHLAAEETLLHSIEKVVGSDEIKFAQETSKRLGFFRPLASFNDNLQIENTRNGMESLVNQSSLNCASSQITQRVDNINSISEHVASDCLQKKEKIPVTIDASTRIVGVNEMIYEENSKKCEEFIDSEAQAQLEIANASKVASKGDDESIIMKGNILLRIIPSSTFRPWKRFFSYRILPRFKFIDLLTRKKPQTVTASNATSELSFAVNSKGEFVAADSQAVLEEENLHTPKYGEQPDNRHDTEREAPYNSSYTTTAERQCKYVDVAVLTEKAPSTMTNASSEFPGNLGEIEATDVQAFIEDKDVDKNKYDEQAVLHSKLPSNASYTTIIENPCKSVDDAITEQESMSPTKNSNTCEGSPRRLGKWNKSEVQALINGYNMHGNDWRAVCDCVPGRDTTQVSLKNCCLILLNLLYAL